MPPLQIALAVIRGTGSVIWIERGTPPSLGRWALPGGRIEPGEDPLEAAQREVLEETELVVTDGLPLAVLTERFETADGTYLYDVIVHVALFADPGGEPVAADGVTATRRSLEPPAPTLAPDRRLATLAPGDGPHLLIARIRVVGDDLAILSWDEQPSSMG
ncbi:MAG: NUDIX domain-containing protein [Thermoleophilia bacterium]|nr:NUDIX domain-containing protein [Thermoleophilia bacterium]